jgi:hypothetical protein
VEEKESKRVDDFSRKLEGQKERIFIFREEE